MIKPTIFGKFILLERINVGGMAEVYRAKLLNNPQFGRYFAIKRILPNLAKDEEFVSMFINEAKVAVELEHPNVCQIYELGRLGQSHYIAMEYIAGRDIAAIQSYYRRQRKIMSVTQACYITAQAAQGLDYAHKAVDSKTGQPLRLVHRDVSPQNLLADFSGLVKLIDFGVAKASQRTINTKDGVLKGKFSYMSPEQAADEPIDHRSDIFAVGVIFWELLTGRRLFVSESEYAILEMIKECNIEKPSKYNKMIPDAVDRICMKALERDPNKRYAWASDMIMDLSSFINSVEPPYSRWHLATWLQKTFAAMYAEEKAKLEVFETINTEEDIERYIKEHASEFGDQPYEGADASKGEKSEGEASDSPKMPDIPGRVSDSSFALSKIDFDKMPAARKSITTSAVSSDLPKKSGSQRVDSQRIDLRKLEEARKAEEGSPVDDFDPNVELTPEGVAPTVSDPEYIRFKHIKRKNAQRRSLASVIITICCIIIVSMILLLTNIIPIPGPKPVLPTDCTLNLSVLPEVDAAKRARIELYTYPRKEDAAPIETTIGSEATFEHLEEGSYVVAVEMKGYEAEEYRVNIEKGPSLSRIEMKHPLPVMINFDVEVAPEDAHLYVNSKLERGSGGLRRILGQLDHDYTVKVTRQGYKAVTKSFKLEDEGTKVKFDLEKAPGSIEVKASEAANVFLCVGDAACVEKGVAPVTIQGIDASEEDIAIEVRSNAGKVWRKSLNFEDKLDYRIFADLQD